MRNLRIFLMAAAVCFLTETGRTEGILMSWGAKDLVGMTQEKYEAAKEMKPEEIINGNKKVASWPETYLLLVAAFNHEKDKDFLNGLIEQVGDSEKKNADRYEKTDYLGENSDGRDIFRRERLSGRG
ncbi:hypothetical protein TRIP_C20767 [Candidatus Zixiibacteriota bacterium]|nr:hypothetical protein TRIP_C20767 [candidate division Zixibacteria bacterium]